MERKINSYKRRYDRELRHIKLILVKNKITMPHNQWLQLVFATKKSIIEHPRDFFTDIPKKKILSAAVEKVFAGFFQDQKIRDSQNFLKRY